MPHRWMTVAGSDHKASPALIIHEEGTDRAILTSAPHTALEQQRKDKLLLERSTTHISEPCSGFLVLLCSAVPLTFISPPPVVAKSFAGGTKLVSPGHSDTGRH